MFGVIAHILRAVLYHEIAAVYLLLCLLFSLFEQQQKFYLRKSAIILQQTKFVCHHCTASICFSALFSLQHVPIKIKYF